MVSKQTHAPTAEPDPVEVMRRATEAAYRDFGRKLQALAALRGEYVPADILDASCDIEEYLEPAAVITRTNKERICSAVQKILSAAQLLADEGSIPADRTARIIEHCHRIIGEACAGS